MCFFFSLQKKGEIQPVKNKASFTKSLLSSLVFITASKFKIVNLKHLFLAFEIFF